MGFWLTRDLDRKELTRSQRTLIRLPEDESHVSFVVAGLDLNYIATSTEPVYGSDGSIINWNWEGFISDRLTHRHHPLRQARGSDISMVAIRATPISPTST